MKEAILAILMPLIITCFTTTMVSCEQQVPCYFVFGDSFSDVGNNNDLDTKAKANFPPYGIDFPGGIPTGRFSNGRNAIDRIKLLGFDEYIPPYSRATGKQILKGVNYASGAAGIRSETSQHLGERISLDQQLSKHATLTAKFSWHGNISSLGECLYTVFIGANDYINNYFMPDKYPSSSIYNPDEYADELIRQYRSQLKTLHRLGARKIAVFGLGDLIGCTLAEIYIFQSNGSLCVDNINAAVKPFNQKLISLIDDLNNKLSGAQFTYIGSSAYTDRGLSVADAPCCKISEDYQCIESSAPCESPNNYIFWDGLHTTEMVNLVTAENAYTAQDSDNVHPMDIKTLVHSTHQEFMIYQLKKRKFGRILV